MEWTDIREFADRPVSIPFSGTVRVDLRSDLRVASRDIAALSAIEAEVDAFCAQVCREFAGARGLFADCTAPTPTSDQLLPWLPRRQGAQEPFAFHLREARLAARLDLRRPLAGQQIAESIGVAGFQPSAYSGLDARPIVFSIETIELEDGSLIAKIKGAITFTTTALTLALAAFATPYGQQQYDDYSFSQDIQRVVQGQECETRSRWHVDLSSLRQAALQDLNYDEPGIRAEVRALRVCNVQLALALAQGSPRLVDGLPGPGTRAALSLFAGSKGLSPKTSVADERLRGLLLEELQRRRR